MPVNEILEILKAFNRYVTYMNNHGLDEVINSIRVDSASIIVTMKGHMGELYELNVYLSSENGELCVEDIVSGGSVLDFFCSIEEYGLTKEVLNYIKSGNGGKGYGKS